MKTLKLIPLLVLTACFLTGCGVDFTEPQNQVGEAFKISITAKVGAVYTVTPQGNVRFSKIETVISPDTTETKTLYYLNRVNRDSVLITITKDNKRLFGKVFNKNDTLVKEFIMDNGVETRVVKF